jgi:hypothetical protein
MTQASHTYLAFGLTIAVDRPVAGWLQGTSSAVPDFQVSFDSPPALLDEWATEQVAPSYVSPFLNDEGRPYTVAWESLDRTALRLHLCDDSQFLFDFSRKCVWIAAGPADPTAVLQEFTGSLVAIVLRRRGVVCLHASVIGISGRAIAIVGPQGAGKSSLAAAFVLRGSSMVTDDIAALRQASASDATSVEPAGHVIRCRRGVIESVAERLGRSSELRVDIGGTFVDLDVAQSARDWCTSALPLGAIYYLDGHRAAGVQVDVDLLTGTEALMILIGDTWATRLITREERAHEFDVLSELVQRVPVRRLSIGDRANDLLAITDAVSADIAHLLGVSA